MNKRSFHRSLLAMAVCATLSASTYPAVPVLRMGPASEKPKKPFFSLQSKQTDAGTVAELLIYDEIGFWGITAKDFATQLDAIAKDAVEVVVAVNSPGGDVFDAFAIYNALRRYSGKVTARVDGYAASAASLVIMAADKIVMPENAMLMIHNIWTFTAGTAADLRATADMMDKAREGILAAYRNKSGQSDEELIRMMDETTWMTALEAQALGFCDVIEEPVKLAASARTVDLLARLPKTPDGLLASIEIKNEGEPPPAANPPADPAPAPAPDPDPVTPSNLVAHVYSRCRTEKIGHLAEGVLMTCGLKDTAGVDSRIAAAKEIAGLCLAAKLPDMAGSLVASGLDVEQARARLFDAVTARDAGEINPRQHPQASGQQVEAGPNPSSIYAARRAAVSTNPSSRRN